MKPILAFVGAFVVAVAASTGASVAIHKGPARIADSVAAVTDSIVKDSLRKDSLAAASGDSAKRVPDSTARAAAPGAAPGAAPASLVKPVVSPPGLVKRAAVDTAAADSAIGVERRLAKLFSAMDADVAAKTLEHMTDSDVQIILGYVGTRQAAAILGAMPADRVAALSKLTLHGRGQ